MYETERFRRDIITFVTYITIIQNYAHHMGCKGSFLNIKRKCNMYYVVSTGKDYVGSIDNLLAVYTTYREALMHRLKLHDNDSCNVWRSNVLDNAEYDSWRSDSQSMAVKELITPPPIYILESVRGSFLKALHIKYDEYNSNYKLYNAKETQSGK